MSKLTCSSSFTFLEPKIPNIAAGLGTVKIFKNMG